MGGKAGKVTQVVLQEDNPASRSSVSSPFTVASDNGVPFPLFRSWFSTSSTFCEASSSAGSFLPFRDLPCFVLFGPYRRPLKPVVARNGDGGVSRSSSLDPRGSRRSLMATRRWTVASGKAQQAMWISNSKPDSVFPQFAIFDIKADVGFEGIRKVPDTLPGLKSTNSEPIECRSLGNVINLNIANVEDPFVHLVGRPTKETFHFRRPETSNLSVKTFVEPIEVKFLHITPVVNDPCSMLYWVQDSRERFKHVKESPQPGDKRYQQLKCM
uniref:Uncharacterized protein n=1 Tax=Cannabis sativa TaxID=3483 RepID=A0A803QME3_CANSA